MLTFCTPPLWRGHLVCHTLFTIVYYSKDFWLDLWCLHQCCAFFGSSVRTSLLVLHSAAPCCRASLLGVGVAPAACLRVLRGGPRPLAPRPLLLSLRAVPSPQTTSRRLLLPRPLSLQLPQPTPILRRPPGLSDCGFLRRRGMLRCRRRLRGGLLRLQPLRLVAWPRCSRRRRLQPPNAAAFTGVRLVAFPPPPLSLRPSLLRLACP